MAQITFKCKHYPNAPSLTKTSETIGKLTHPMISFVISIIPFLILGDTHPLAMPLFVVLLIALLILLPVIRNALFKKLDKKYVEMLAGKIPME